jgi:hypothetical protein
MPTTAWGKQAEKYENKKKRKKKTSVSINAIEL